MTKERELSEKLYPVGTHIRLESIIAPQPILPGECGTVDSIDDLAYSTCAGIMAVPLTLFLAKTPLL